MKKNYVIFFSLLYLSSITINNIFGQTIWFVDKNATGLNNGTSFANGWISFSAINWNLINPGDTLYISGEVNSTVYNEQLSIPAGKHDLVITKGITTGHNGTVIIDGQTLRSYGIYGKATSSGIYNISITRLKFVNCNWAGVYFSGESSGGIHNILIDSCEFVDNLRSGVFMEGSASTTSICKNIVIQRSYFNAPDIYGSQSDLIYLQLLDDITVDHCILMDDNTSLASSDLHDDNIQCYLVNNVTFSNNIASKQSAKTKGTQEYFLEGGSGICKIYNNVAYSNTPNQEDATIRVKTRNSGTYIYNNSVYNTQDQCVNTDDPTTIIKNNIFYSAGTHYHNVMVQFASRTTGGSDYNIYYDPSSNFSNVTGGMGTHDIKANPEFVNVSDINTFNLSVNPGSPAINAGTNLGSPFNVDILMRPRPTFAAWDIGPYEVIGTPTGLLQNNLAPATFSLEQNYPNPFNPTTTINYSVSQASFVTIKVYNLLGSEVATLINEQKAPGNYNIQFNGSRYASGVYFYRMQAGDFVQTKKLVLMK